MLTLLCAAVLFSAQAAGAADGMTLETSVVCRTQALKEKPLSVARDGEFQVWGWAAAGAEVLVRVGDRELKAGAVEPKDKETHAWVSLGTVPLKAGPCAVSPGAGVAAVALSRAAGFDPARHAANTRANHKSPDAVADLRADRVRHTDTVFTMPRFDSLEAWEAAAARLRRRLLLSSGLVPMPEETPLNAKIFDRIEHDDYSVEKVHFEVRPGFLATGNLYRPKGEGPFPAVLNPHGHWKAGRLEDTDTCSVAARCITLARMGAVAFTYDMIGYVDSRQFSHNWGREREKLWGVHPFALQLHTSLRAVDFLCSLPGVDPERLGCTGASGGGTQTFALTAVDPRIKVAAPVNMISSTMQGGCLCENAPILRLENSNMEVGALMAPRPMMLVSTSGDWTRETPRTEFPAIRSIYSLYGAADRLENVHLDYGHNYNRDSREAVYRFFGKHLIGGRDWNGFTEPAFVKEPDEALRVFPGEGKLAGRKGQTEVIGDFITMNREKWAAALPKDRSWLEDFRTAHGAVIGDVLGVAAPDSNDLRRERLSVDRMEGYVVERWVFGRAAHGDAVPALLYRGANADANPQDAVVLVHGRGKAALADPETGGPGPLVRELVARGAAVLCMDAFLLGEHQPPDARRERKAAGNFMDTFQPTDTGERVQDILTAMAFLRGRGDLTGAVSLAGLDEAGLWCLFAAAVDPQIGRVAADLNRFPLDDDNAWVERQYIPCIRSVGDIRTALALAAPRPCLVMNGADSGGLDWLGAQLAAAVPEPAALADWLL